MRILLVLLFFVALGDGRCRPNGVAPWRKLNDGRWIPSFGLGTWLGFAPNMLVSKSPNNSEVQRAVEWAIDAGYRHIDTATFYDTEEEIGQAIQNKIKQGVVRREHLYVTTKLFNDKHKQSDVIPALQESLKRLNLEYVDLYLMHTPFATLPFSITLLDIDYLETWTALIKAQQLGLARSIGVSNFNQTMIQRLENYTGVKPAVLQVEINLNLQQPELLDYCCKEHILVTGYTPFGALFYNNQFPDSPPPRVDDRELVGIAEKHNKTVTQIVLRYIWELGVVPIPKSITKSRIEDNINIFDFRLEQKDKDTLRQFERHYRTLPLFWWKDTPLYPFYPY